jgi:hypothetical protein
MGVSGQLHALAALLPGKSAPGTHWIGGWVSPRTGLHAVVKRKFPALAETRTPQPSSIPLSHPGSFYKGLKIKIYKTIVLPVVFMGVKLGLSHRGKNRD